MQCFSPVNIEQGKRVPCGKCMACRIARTREWTMRIMHEVGKWETSGFVTLTYRSMPEGGSLDKIALQRFFKRLRKDLAPRKIKHYSVGEYGETYGRPHYHSIIFGVGAMDEEVIEDAWSNGFVSIGTVTNESVQYVAGYVQKKLSGSQGRKVYGGKVAPFQIQSLGIGKEWLEENEERIINGEPFIKKMGNELALPRYYVKKIKERHGETVLNEMLNARSLKRAEEHRKFLADHKVDPLSEAELDRLQRKQGYETMKARYEIRRKGKL